MIVGALALSYRLQPYDRRAVTFAHGIPYHVRVLGGEYDGTEVDLARVEDASAEVADEARQLVPAATVSVQPGSTGKGAAGPGIELVLRVGKRC
jgi:hypothetical protein